MWFLTPPKTYYVSELDLEVKKTLIKIKMSKITFFLKCMCFIFGICMKYTIVAFQIRHFQCQIFNSIIIFLNLLILAILQNSFINIEKNSENSFLEIWLFFQII